MQQTRKKEQTFSSLQCKFKGSFFFYQYKTNFWSDEAMCNNASSLRIKMINGSPLHSKDLFDIILSDTNFPSFYSICTQGRINIFFFICLDDLAILDCSRMTRGCCHHCSWHRSAPEGGFVFVMCILFENSPPPRVVKVTCCWFCDTFVLHKNMWTNYALNNLFKVFFNDNSYFINNE